MARPGKLENSDLGHPLPHDPNFKGPVLGKRSCTDIICLLLFLVFIVCWIVIGVFAWKNGDPNKIIAPVDYKGYHCGIDDPVKNKPYLLFFDISKCGDIKSSITKGCNTPQVCLEKCPDENFYSDLYDKSNPNDVTKDQRKYLCKYDIDPKKITVYKILKENVDNNNCAKGYFESESILGRCLPLPFLKKMLDNSSEIVFDVGGTKYNIRDPRLPHNIGDEILNGTEAASSLNNIFQISQLIVQDLSKSWYLIIAGLGIAMVLCLIYIILMRCLAGIMVWFSILAVIAVLSYCCYASYMKYREVSKYETNQDVSLTNVDAILSLKQTWIVFLIASAVALLIILIMIVFLRKRIRIAVALIRQGSKAVSSSISALFFPILPWILQAGVIIWTVTVGIYLYSIGNPKYRIQSNDTRSECKLYKNGDECDIKSFSERDIICEVNCVLTGFSMDKYAEYLQFYNIFGFFWGLFFISALSEMVLAGTFATWYWSWDKSKLPYFTVTSSFLRTLRYHIGTLAFGSLIVTICRVIRVILEYIDHKLKLYNNAFVRAILCCMKCFFWCLEKFIKFINRNAYIMCAIHGKNFCTSAKNAFNLIMRNILRVFVLDKVTDFLFFIGKILITATMCALAFFFFTKNSLFIQGKVNIPQLNYYIVPVIIIGFGTYFIASVFFGVYAMAVDTLFLCFLEDMERNDGSPEKPYFMPKELMKILGKKNKKIK